VPECYLFPVQFGTFVALIRRASFTSSLMAPVMVKARPVLTVISATTRMSLSAQVKVIMSQSLSAAEAPELICSASRSAQTGYGAETIHNPKRRFCIASW
jgi:hypothetical protein